MASNFKVDVQINSKAIEADIRKGIAKALKELTPKLLAKARSNHRYTDQTGALTNSTMVSQIVNGISLSASVNYALYIHDGFKTWSPDPWLENTLNNNMNMILASLNKHIAATLK
jgi:hypothetical protein